VPSALTTQQRAVLIVASVAVGLAFLDETAVVTALRAIQADLGLSSTELQWVTGAYLLALASLMAAAGRLADVHGRRRTFVISAGIFAVGSAVCALAPSAGVLIGGRGVQGVGAALIVPLGMPTPRSSWLRNAVAGRWASSPPGRRCSWPPGRYSVGCSPSSSGGVPSSR